MIVPAGLKPGANRRLAGEDVRKGAVVLPAGRRLAAQDVALAAAVGLTDAAGAAARARRAVLDRRRDRRAGQRRGPPPRSTTPTATLLAGMLDRLGAAVTDLGILKDDPAALEQAIADAARDHDLVLTSGGVSTGEADHVRERRREDRHAGVLARRHQAGPAGGDGRDPRRKRGDGAAFVGLPGNPVAAFVTFVRVVRPLLLRLAGALPEPLTALPVRLAFAYKKKTGRREYVRVALRAGADGDDRSGQASAGGRRRHHVADRDRRACWSWPEDIDHGRAGRRPSDFSPMRR